MSLTRSLKNAGLKPGGRHGLSSKETRDPIGLMVAALNKLAQSDVLDRIGLRKQAEQTVFTVTRSGFKTATTAGRTFARKGKKGKDGVRVAPAPAKGVFDLTPTEDEQMLVDVVTEFAEEMVRPAAAEANDACAAPDELLAAGLEIGLPILGVPESLGGISEERSAMAGTLVAEALGKGDMGLAVAALAPGSVATAIGLWGTDEQQSTYLPAFTGETTSRQPPSRSTSPRSSSTCSSRARRRSGRVTPTSSTASRPSSRAGPTPSSSSSARGSTTSPCCSWWSPPPTGSPSRATRRWVSAPPRSPS